MPKAEKKCAVVNLLGSGKQLVKVEVSFFLSRRPEVEVVLSQVPQVQFKPLQVKHPILPLRHQVINSLIPSNFYYICLVDKLWSRALVYQWNLLKSLNNH